MRIEKRSTEFVVHLSIDDMHEIADADQDSTVLGSIITYAQDNDDRDPEEVDDDDEDLDEDADS